MVGKTAHRCVQKSHVLALQNGEPEDGQKLYILHLDTMPNLKSATKMCSRCRHKWVSIVKAQHWVFCHLHLKQKI